MKKSWIIYMKKVQWTFDSVTENKYRVKNLITINSFEFLEIANK